jgi:hypothetical protein
MARRSCWRPRHPPDRQRHGSTAAFSAQLDRRAAGNGNWVLADSLSRPPRGYAADHPAIDDIRRKDFIGLAPLSFAEATS